MGMMGADRKGNVSMLRKLTALGLSILLFAALAACGAPIKAEKGLKVLASFNAMYELVSAVGGDKVSVSAIVPDGMEAHDFEPKAKDIAALRASRVLVLNGLSMEPWAEEAIASAKNDALIVVEASKGVEPIALSDTENGHGGYDPHVWLSPKAAQVEVDNIAAALAAADPENAEFYKKNAASYNARLEALASDYAQKLEALTKKDFVTGHAAFAYLCRDLSLTQVSVADVFDTGEPSARRLSELVEYCKANGVTVIFAEALAATEVSRTLANEAGAELKTIYTMESAEDGLTYLERMEKNLQGIYESLAGSE
ncbi:MAG: zinc ABC transporter substrate-binding protein [Clostridiaceae bacterium]|nr:zinc ABC transporter substrate-binding protein [Eubacteriales bacterium]